MGSMGRSLGGWVVGAGTVGGAVRVVVSTGGRIVVVVWDSMSCPVRFVVGVDRST